MSTISGNKDKPISKSYYNSLSWYLITSVIIVSFAPMMLVGFVILQQFQRSYTDKVNAHLNELVLKHKQHIDHFLEEKTEDLKVLLKTSGIDRLRDEKILSKKLSILQAEYRGGFVDLGIVNQDGKQIAYAGPFKLDQANYAQAPWFRKAMNEDIFISDVFLGLRGLPHFIISIKQTIGDTDWIIRATIDFVTFSNLVENIRIGETGFAFIVNRENEFQTKTRIDISREKPFYQHLIEAPKGALDDVRITRQRVAEANGLLKGDEYIYVSSFLKDGEWLLVYRQNTSDAFSIVRSAKRLALLIFVCGGLGIITMAIVLSRRVIGLVAKADMEKEMMNQQVIETSKLASVGELASGVAHEINNPVAIMVEEAGWIQDLLEEEEFAKSTNLDEFQRALRQIKTQGNRCKEITHKLLSFARRTESNSQEISINTLLLELVDLTKQRTKYNNVSVKLDMRDELPVIPASSTEMQQIFLNLVNNAIDAMDTSGGVVNITTRFTDNKITVAISDTGPGIPKSNLDRIFDPFFTTKPVGKGTGLGLSICYGIVKKMGGQIQVKSEVGTGTTFTVSLPAVRAMKSDITNQVTF
ncbi:MAG TPA: two-component sensor histidine kinase [Desulfobacteraceae bacterium]|nr:two-component sensor histidine kinase [Desulfobacteraceae bacterium]